MCQHSWRKIQLQVLLCKGPSAALSAGTYSQPIPFTKPPPLPRRCLPDFLLKTASTVPSCAAFNKVCDASIHGKQRHVPTLAQKHKAGGFPIGTNTADQLISICILAFLYRLSVISMPFFEYISTSRKEKTEKVHENMRYHQHPFILSSFHPFLFSNPLLVRLLRRSILSSLKKSGPSHLLRWNRQGFGSYECGPKEYRSKNVSGLRGVRTTSFHSSAT